MAIYRSKLIAKIVNTEACATESSANGTNLPGNEKQGLIKHSLKIYTSTRISQEIMAYSTFKPFEAN